MTEKTTISSEKNPLGAAILSAIFPGIGFFYVGNYLKGLAYTFCFIMLIFLITQSSEHEVVVFALSLAAFYIFQVFDSFNAAKKYNMSDVEYEDNPKNISLGSAIFLVILGVLFQVAELGIIRFRDLTKLWPIIPIALGIKFIYQYWRTSREENGISSDSNVTITKNEITTGGNNE